MEEEVWGPYSKQTNYIVQKQIQSPDKFLGAFEVGIPLEANPSSFGDIFVGCGNHCVKVLLLQLGCK